MNSLKQRTISGLKWSSYERLASQGVNYIITIIIARILTPADFGVVGMITIFIGISMVFTEAGFGAALIRKQNRTEVDFLTVFYYNIIISLIFYAILYFTAPYIAMFYNTPILTPITRVVGLNIVIGSLGAIHRTKLIIQINFKTQAIISLFSIFVTGLVGVFLAYSGFGVWAIVYQGLSLTLMSTVLLWIFIRWKPKLIFSWTSFRELFSFGYKLMFSGLLDTIYNNIYMVVIGKHYNATNLGYFTQANNLARLPSSNISTVIQRVTFPVLSEIQEDPVKLEKSYRRLLKMSAFIIFPIMMILVALSHPLIRILLTDKWLPSVPYLQILCLGFMFYPIHAINLNLLQVKGRSDLFLKLEIIKKVLITIVLFVSFRYGIIVICFGMVFISILSLLINTHYTGKLINLGFFKQMKDISLILILSIISGIIAYIPSYFVDNSFLQFFIGGIFGISFFLGSAFILKMEEMKEVTLPFIRYRNKLIK